MRKSVQVMTGVALLAVIGWLGYLWYAQGRPPASPLSALPGDEILIPASPDKPPVTAADGSVGADLRSPPVDPAIANPVEVPPSAAPLPALQESDPEILAGLKELLDHAELAQYFQLESMARKFVISVDNLPSGKLAPQNRVINPVAGSFTVLETEQEIAFNAENYQRYTPLVRVLTELDVTRVARLYRRFYPLLQQAYEDLGYPGAYFNDRLIAVIDHLLAASAPVTPVTLVQPKVFYVYADPDVETASVGHKILFRIGPDHRVSVQRWLSAMRAQLATEGVGSGGLDSPR